MPETNKNSKIKFRKIDLNWLSSKKHLTVYNWIIFLLGSTILFSIVIFILFWITDFFSNTILSNLQLKNNTMSFTWWQRPPVKAVYRIHIFNYTNLKDFEIGTAKKLHVQEVGPYIYRETLSRVNPEISQDGTVTYQEMRIFKWEGGSSPNDEIITVPNVPLFTAMALSRDMNFLAQVSLTALLSTIRAKSFIEVTASDFLWGYDDELFRLAKPVMVWQQNLPYDKFGILAFKAGLSKDRITINSGLNGLQSIGNILRFNGKNLRDIWHNKMCDLVEGSDGSMFSPKLIQNPSNIIKIYAKEMCRPIPLQFDRDTRTKGIPVARYTLIKDAFVSNTTHNSCFCQNYTNDIGNSTLLCSPKGLFNNSACNFGAPLLSSFPHFYQADKSLLTYVDGLRPDRKIHDTYIDLHLRLGVPIGGWSRIQLNLEARKADAVPFMGRIQDGTILPILWIEVGIDKIPKSVMNILYHSHYTLNAVEACVKWGSLIGLLLSVIFLILFVLNQKGKKNNKTHDKNFIQDQVF